MRCAATTVLWVVGESKVWFANIGDTRLYLADASGLRQVSEDESQAVVRRGSGGNRSNRPIDDTEGQSLTLGRGASLLLPEL